MSRPFDDINARAANFGSGAFRVVRVQTDRAGPLSSLLFILTIIVGLLLGLVLLIPLLLISIVAAAGFALYAAARRALRRAHDPNGPLDGRRNVRVIERPDHRDP